jgi:hypothetical protein
MSSSSVSIKGGELLGKVESLLTFEELLLNGVR